MMLDLRDYWSRFDEALRGRYGGQTFKEGFERIEHLYDEVRSNPRCLTADHVMAIFANDLPFVQDWTMPDRQELEKRMKDNRVAEAIYLLRDRSEHSEELIGKIRYGFRELSLTALVLHHVFPKRFAMCSHHLASLLYITNAPTVPKFYMEYCNELQLWSKEKAKGKLSVVETEYALWTWYRLTYYGREEEKRKNRKNFYEDPWVQERRAKKIAESLGNLGRLDLARSYVDTAPTLAAILAWREFEVTVRDILARGGQKISKKDRISVPNLIALLPMEALCRDRVDLTDLWERRNDVMHNGESITQKKPFQDMTAAERVDEKRAAGGILARVVEFIEYNT